MKALKFSHVSSGFIAILIGYTSSVAIIFQAATAAGAGQELINSWLLALGFGMGLSSIGLSYYFKSPILTAWSTPGAAMLATSLVNVPMSEAVGAFLLSGALITLSGLTGSFERLSKIIPPAIAAAMLAGVLLPFCLEIFVNLQNDFVLVASMCGVYLIGKRYFSIYTIPLVLSIGVLVSWKLGLFDSKLINLKLASFIYTAPSFSITSFISIAIPLFIVTMTSQNMPGIVAMNTAGFKPPLSPIITTTGIATLLLAPFGGFSFNLAAITAAICMSEDADDNPKTRYLAAVSGGIFYLLAALFGATIVALFTISPKALVLSLAGLALLGTLGNCLSQSLEKAKYREPALITFLVTSSGIVFLGVGAAFWGLIAGLLVQIVVSKKTDSS